jgi:hypothetical protein
VLSRFPTRNATSFSASSSKFGTVTEDNFYYKKFTLETIYMYHGDCIFFSVLGISEIEHFGSHLTSNSCQAADRSKLVI